MTLDEYLTGLAATQAVTDKIVVDLYASLRGFSREFDTAPEPAIIEFLEKLREQVKTSFSGQISFGGIARPASQ